MSNQHKNKTRALVISGGGSKGAFAGGIATHLLNDCCHNYQIFVGTSAGSLLAPLLALGETDRLKAIFTNIRQEDIFNVCPFIIRKKHGLLTYRINHFNTVWMFLQGKRTFGESKNLRKLIQRIFTADDYQRLRDGKKDVVVSVANLSCNKIEYHSVHDNSYEDFCDWMWISANFVPFMSLVIKNGMEYADGGFGAYLPLQEAIRKGATEIDAIMLQPEVAPQQCQLPTTNAFGLLTRTIDFMLDQIGVDDLDLGHLHSMQQQVSLNCFYTPRVLTENSFIFDSAQMTAWWNEGYYYAAQKHPTCHKIKAG